MLYYFDNCATTRVDDDIVEILNKYHKEAYFNPSARSNHSLQVANDIARARAEIGRALGASGDEIYFTSGGTESDNIAIGGAIKNLRKGNVVLTAAEHSAAYNTAMEYCARLDVRIAKSLPDGHIDVEDFLAKVDGDTALAIFMHVNNETGAVNDVRQIASAVKKINPNAITFSDGVQAVGKIPVNLRSLGVDAYSFSGHKLHCTKGIGGLYVKKGAKINPIVQGGGQESGLRSGTEYVGGQIALAEAVKRCVAGVGDNAEKFLRYKQIVRNALSEIPLWLENCTTDVSPAIMSLAFAGVKSEVLLRMLEDNGVIVGTGSACSSKSKQSRVAKAIGVPMEYSEGLLRISFSKYNDQAQAEFLAQKLCQCVTELRAVMLGGR